MKYLNSKTRDFLAFGCYLLVGLCLFSLAGFAQSDAAVEESKQDEQLTRLKVGDTEIIIRHKAAEGKPEIFKNEAEGTTRLKIGDTEIIILDDDYDGDDWYEEDDDDDFEPWEEGDDEDDHEYHDDNDNWIHISKKDSVIRIGSRGHHQLKKVSTRWILFDIGINTLLQDGSFDFTDEAAPFELAYGKSWNFNIHLFRQRLSLYKNKVNLLYGASFEFYNYRFNDPITLIPNVSPLEVTINEGIEYKKNKLFTSFISAPLMLNYESNPRHPKKSFHLSIGAFGGLRLGGHTKQKTEEMGKVKIKDDFNLSNVRYGFTSQFGYGPVYFYLNYAANSFFKEGAGPELQPLNFGITVIPF